ncbi:MAG: efflux RND transporter permease subunit, partial [Polyangiaceae bacterium]|nr:efflux RND transporter permease subunit [Polyangiaceae bacterium]
IVFTEWPGRSPRDVEDQLSYPLTTSLLGIPGVRTVRSFSMFGFSTIYVIFEEGVDFYWSRSRVLEKLASLPSNTLPVGVSPALGPDATALGQVFWYTLEGRTPEGNVTGGWDQHELRTIQDWTVRYALQSVPGVSEVASVGGYVKEYQVDVDSDAMRAAGVSIDQIANAVRQANLDVGARTLELNRVEYVVRGVGFIQRVEDLEEVVVKNVEHTPIRVRDVAHVTLGPALRRGALDKGGAPVVGGVVVARFGANPMAIIERVKEKIAEISPGLPTRTREDGTTSKVTIVPFYDRTSLINETLGTLSSALLQEILITIIVVLVMLRHLRSSLIISSVLPLGVLGAFILMRVFGVDANIMALSGIAIAIGTMVDMGIVLTENMVEHLERAGPNSDRRVVIRRAAAEVAPAIVTSTLTTVVGFLPIFALTASEGKLFTPLAYTKTFAMLGALLLVLTVLPVVGHLILHRTAEPPAQLPRGRRGWWRALTRPARLVELALASAGVFLAIAVNVVLGLLLVVVAGSGIAGAVLPRPWSRLPVLVSLATAVVAVTVLLADDWLPLGAGRGWWVNRLFVAAVLAALLGLVQLFILGYPFILRWALRHKATFLAVPASLIVFGVTTWLGFDTVFGWLPRPIRTAPAVSKIAHHVPGFGREFMPPFDEGSYLYMPTTMPHASMAEVLRQLAEMDAAIAAVPEVEQAVGKLGRVESALDPAPISMYETVVNYRSEYKLDANGRRITFQFDADSGEHVRDAQGELILDRRGRPFRQWREHIRTTEDIWNEIQAAAAAPGMTGAPKLMPIAARIVMLQSGMRAPMGMKIRGPDLDTLEQVAVEMESLLKQVPGIRPETVVADRIVGKPYLEIVIDRREIARHGISIEKVQQIIQMGVGGMTVTRTVEGRERCPVRVRYMREERSDVEDLRQVLVPSPLGHQIPLSQLASIRYVRGPQVIKSEDTFLTAYVVFDKVADRDEVGVVEDAKAFLTSRLESGELKLPPGVSYAFAGSYENQVRSAKTLSVLVPMALALIFLLIYLQFRRVTTTLGVFSGVAVAMAGGFLLIWLYGQPWFLNVAPLGIDFRELLQVHSVNLSVAVWVGFLALLGIATDDGVVMSTYLHQRFSDGTPPASIEEVRERIFDAGMRRVRPCMMTTATTLLALLPVVTSTGRGSDVMVPMTLPLLGGMSVEVITLFVVPVFYALSEEVRLRRCQRGSVVPALLTEGGEPVAG